jgi:nucleotide-binding universal stress UspA family protein
MGAQMVREVASKTSDQAGDGTTTAMSGDTVHDPSVRGEASLVTGISCSSGIPNLHCNRHPMGQVSKRIDLSLADAPRLSEIKANRTVAVSDFEARCVMTIKDILLPLTSYPTPTQKCAIESAVHLAVNLGVLVRAVAFEVNVESPVGLYADPVGVAGILAADRKKSAHNAHELLDAFETIAQGVGLVHERQLLGCRLLEIPEYLAREAHFRDVAMVPLRDPTHLSQDIAEQLVFASDRPILAFPEDPNRTLSANLENVAIAWDFSAPGTRAIADALPFLRQAKQIRVFTVIDDKPIEKSHSGARLAKHLARHGVEAVAEDITSSGRAIGHVFKDYVVKHRNDLLVMGAYGHSRIREFILGGATKSVLLHPPTWVLLSH